MSRSSLIIVYYQMQDENGPVASSNPLYPSEPSVSRFPIPLVFPLPHDAHNILEHIFRAEKLSVDETTQVFLYETSSPRSLESTQHIDVQSESGPGSSILRPFICVIVNTQKTRRPPGWMTLSPDRGVKHALRDEGRDVLWASNTPLTNGMY